MLCGFPWLLGLLKTRAHRQILMTYHSVMNPANQTGQVLAVSQIISQAQSTITDPELCRRAPCKGKTKQYMETDAARLNQTLTSTAV